MLFTKRIRSFLRSSLFILHLLKKLALGAHNEYLECKVQKAEHGNEDRNSEYVEAYVEPEIGDVIGLLEKLLIFLERSEIDLVVHRLIFDHVTDSPHGHTYSECGVKSDRYIIS